MFVNENLDDLENLKNLDNWVLWTFWGLISSLRSILSSDIGLHSFESCYFPLWMLPDNCNCSLQTPSLCGTTDKGLVVWVLLNILRLFSYYIGHARACALVIKLKIQHRECYTNTFNMWITISSSLHLRKTLLSKLIDKVFMLQCWFYVMFWNFSCWKS